MSHISLSPNRCSPCSSYTLTLCILKLPKRALLQTEDPDDPQHNFLEIHYMLHYYFQTFTLGCNSIYRIVKHVYKAVH